MDHEPRRNQEIPSPPTSITIGSCTVSISDIRSRYPALRAFVRAEMTQDFDIIHNNDIKRAIQNFRKSNKDEGELLGSELRDFRQEYKEGDCSEAAWIALGAQSGIALLIDFEAR